MTVFHILLISTADFATQKSACDFITAYRLYYSIAYFILKFDM